jgi:hypothetical protein
VGRRWQRGCIIMKGTVSLRFQSWRRDSTHLRALQHPHLDGFGSPDHLRLRCRRWANPHPRRHPLHVWLRLFDQRWVSSQCSYHCLPHRSGERCVVRRARPLPVVAFCRMQRYRDREWVMIFGRQAKCVQRMMALHSDRRTRRWSCHPILALLANVVLENPRPRRRGSAAAETAWMVRQHS